MIARAGPYLTLSCAGHKIYFINYSILCYCITVWRKPVPTFLRVRNTTTAVFYFSSTRRGVGHGRTVWQRRRVSRVPVGNTGPNEQCYLNKFSRRSSVLNPPVISVSSFRARSTRSRPSIHTFYGPCVCVRAWVSERECVCVCVCARVCVYTYETCVVPLPVSRVRSDREAILFRARKHVSSVRVLFTNSTCL